MNKFFLLIVVLLQACGAWNIEFPRRTQNLRSFFQLQQKESSFLIRRQIPISVYMVSTAASVAMLTLPLPSHAIDSTELMKYTQAGRMQGEKMRSNVGADLSENLKQMKLAQDALDAADLPFTELPGGASFREYREGKGSRAVQVGSEVAVQMSVRCKSFSTQNEPGGVQYYSTTGGIL